MIFETERLILRPLTWDDRAVLCRTLQDPLAMYAYEHPFSEAEVDQWLERQLGRYQTEGFGLWGVVRKADARLIGQAGITLQDWAGRRVPEIGYLLERPFWHQGYATEAARGCKRYGFETLGLELLCSIIRENNLPSRRVAERNGMQVVDRMIKHYFGLDMPHLVYTVTRQDTQISEALSAQSAGQKSGRVPPPRSGRG